MVNLVQMRPFLKLMPKRLASVITEKMYRLLKRSDIQRYFTLISNKLEFKFRIICSTVYLVILPADIRPKIGYHIKIEYMAGYPVQPY